MNLPFLQARLRDCPLVASVQASPGPLDHPDTLLRMAKASLKQGVRVLRLEGVKNIRTIQPEVKTPIIGLLKRSYPGTDVYITPTAQDADAIIELGCQVIALDATLRPRQGKDDVAALIAHIHRRKRLAMADCDSVESAVAAARAGADIIGTTLAGYTPARPATIGPDLALLREIMAAVREIPGAERTPILAEGRYSERWEIDSALRIGASGVVVGGALNDPIKRTRALMPSVVPTGTQVGAVDIGGSNLRFAVFDSQWQMDPESVRRTANPGDRHTLLAWIRERIEESGVARLGLGTGGVTDPRTGIVGRAKVHLMPDHEGIEFSQGTLGIPVYAHGDGHATAWGHACRPEFAGLRTATLAIGTGVGCGFVADQRIWCGRDGDYPRINDLPSATGESYEALLGGIHLTSTPTTEQTERARIALRGAVAAINGLYFPDAIVISGTVGLSDALADTAADLGLHRSPFGVDAGLHGAAALALYPFE